MKNSFKKLVAVLTVLVMAIALVAVPNVSAKADDAKATITFANDYDWAATGVYAYASKDASQNIATLTLQSVGTYSAFCGLVLERDANYNYVVAKSDFNPADEYAVDQEAFGDGKIIIMVHDAGCTDKASFEFLKNLKEGDVLAANTYWEAFAAASGAVTTEFSFTIAKEGSVGPQFPFTKGALELGNAIDENGAKVSAFVTDDANATLSTLTADSKHPDLPYWYSFVAEKDADGAYVVKVVDMVASDGANACKDVKLGEGKILVAWHDAATDADSKAFFSVKVAEGTKLYLVGDVADGDLTDVYLSLEKPAEEGGTTPEPEIPNKGDNFVPMFVVLFAGLAMVTVATIARKKNA